MAASIGKEIPWWQTEGLEAACSFIGLLRGLPECAPCISNMSSRFARRDMLVIRQGGVSTLQSGVYGRCGFIRLSGCCFCCWRIYKDEC